MVYIYQCLELKLKFKVKRCVKNGGQIVEMSPQYWVPSIGGTFQYYKLKKRINKSPQKIIRFNLTFWLGDSLKLFIKYF